MINYLKSQIWGLFCFIVIFTLFYYLIVGPLAVRNAGVLALTGIMWLIIRIFYSEKKGFGLSSSLSATSIFVLREVNAIPDLYIQGSAIAMVAVSHLALIALGIHLILRKDGNAVDYWLIAIGRLILTFTMIFAIKIWLMPLILAL